MAECQQCKTAIRGELVIMCEGVCAKRYSTVPKSDRGLTNTPLAYWILTIIYVLCMMIASNMSIM